jgi:hypothetical protein
VAGDSEAVVAAAVLLRELSRRRERQGPRAQPVAGEGEGEGEGALPD